MLCISLGSCGCFVVFVDTCASHTYVSHTHTALLGGSSVYFVFACLTFFTLMLDLPALSPFGVPIRLHIVYDMGRRVARCALNTSTRKNKEVRQEECCCSTGTCYRRKREGLSGFNSKGRQPRLWRTGHASSLLGSLAVTHYALYVYTPALDWQLPHNSDIDIDSDNDRIVPHQPACAYT